MTTYNTYQEAKIANPECEIYQLERNGLFSHCDHHKAELVRFVEFDSAGIKCNPADYCVRYDDFLTIGHRFVDGDAFLNSRGEVVVITNAQSNNRIIDGDEKRFILRAAALEENQESQHDMQESQSNSHQQLMETLNDACGIFGCIPSYLIKNIEGLMATNKEYAKALSGNVALEKRPRPKIHPDSEFYKKPRTKVEYVKVTDSIFDLRPDFEAGELFSKVNHARDYSTINNTQTLAQALHQSCCYRRIETPITEREAFIEEVSKCLLGANDPMNPGGVLFDSGKFKLVN